VPPRRRPLAASIAEVFDVDTNKKKKFYERRARALRTLFTR
jgi:hypothetical protein